VNAASGELERIRLSCERTMMSWLRTALALIAFGFGIYKFFQYLEANGQAHGGAAGALGAREFALLMIGTGIVALVLATIDHRRNMQRLRAQYGALPSSYTGMLAGLIALLGVIGLLAALLRL
jgi:putative membrane protein